MGKRRSDSPRSSESKAQSSCKKTRNLSPNSESGTNQNETGPDCEEVAVRDGDKQTSPVLLLRSIVQTACWVSDRLKAIGNLAEGVMEIHSKWNENWDGMDDLSSGTSRYLYLIRHGQYNLDGPTDNERYLTPYGIEQAKQTGARLLKTGRKFLNLTSSNMTRALETSMQILREIGDFDMGFTIDCILREGFPAIPDPPESSDKKSKSTDNCRIEGAFKKYFHRAPSEQMNDSHELIVCHSNVLRYFICRAMQFQPNAWLRISLAHASITQLQIRADGRVTMRSVNETTHFPQHLITYS